jgi:tRNA (guanine-N7-)-methyltransferase
MRLRNKKWVKQYLQDNENFMINPEEELNAYKVFDSNRDIFLEIGAGKSKFCTELAQQNPDVNIIAMEKEPTVVAVGLRQCLKKQNITVDSLRNLKYVITYLEKYEKNIASDSIVRIYLNFSDPWPKARHAKYRLTGRKYLKIYNRILADGGEIHIKTDNDGLYKFTLDEVIFSNFKIIANESDLYNNAEMMKNNIQTSYETKFVDMGIKIKKIVLRKKGGQPKRDNEKQGS